ncbi:MAG: hypothetical protein PHX03_04020, partial [Bacilli bacterium]|nr:hypothetical protein [Bacilli bacterium]
NKPKNGSVIVNSDGDVKLALHDGTYCAEKAYEDSEITITTKTVEECIGSTLPTDEIEKNYFVNNVNDDGWTEETSEKNFYNNDNNVRVGYASSYRSLWVKWNNIDIPKGSIVKSAKIKFKSSDSPSGDMDQYTKTILYFNNVGNAVAPLNFDDMENKNKTTNNVTWEMPETIGNTWYESPDISALVQEVINRSDWQSGNALMLLHTRHPDITCCEFNDRTFKSYETGAENAPQLIITYSPQ